jgi:hypothetical protein
MSEFSELIRTALKSNKIPKAPATSLDVLKEFDSAILLYLTGYKRKCGIKFVGAFLNRNILPNLKYPD